MMNIYNFLLIYVETMHIHTHRIPSWLVMTRVRDRHYTRKLKTIMHAATHGQNNGNT